MNLKKLLLTSFFSAGIATSMLGQELPAHPMYVLFGTDEPLNEYFDDWMAKWETGGQLTEDDNFFISRIRKKERFTDVRTQVNPELDPNRKVTWWCPVGESSKKWGPLPRYNFNADVFSMWQYLDVHANWSNIWFRVPGTFSDAAHKNGVETGCLKFCDWGNSITTGSPDGKIFAVVSQKNPDGSFKYAESLVKMLNFYGIDGIGVNPEGSWDPNLAYQFQDFLAQCHIEAEKLGMNFRVDWYDSNNNDGALGFRSNQLDTSNQDWFQHVTEDVPVTDVFMLNYNWYNSQLSNSIAHAKRLGRSPYDVYAGIDLEGRGWSNAGNNWQLLGANKEISILFWGHHARNMLFGASSEFGSSDLTVQRYYQEKQELAFTGGTRNPANTPELAGDRIDNTYGSLQKFNGVSKLITARSVLNELPFITRFNLGNGLFFNNEGVTTFNHKWYNLGMQDYLPTWRWWILDDNGQVPADAIKCDFTFDDAWFGGSCLKLHGTTKKSNIRMFKTQFEIPSGCDISLRYKLKNGTKTHLSLIWTEDGVNYSSHALPDARVSGEWTEFKIKSNTLGVANKTILALGLAAEDTDNDYEILLGELAIQSRKTFTPVKPEITKSTFLERRYNAADFKLIFKSKDSDSPTLPVYNDEVDTWYFEIYSQAEGADPVLCTTTTSWAAYVVDAPVLAEAEKVRFGVRAVAPDGKTYSDFAWSDYIAQDITPVDYIETDKPIIKPDEEFTVKYSDPYHATAKWEIIDPITEQAIKTAEDATSITHAINKVGVYDLRITCNGEIAFTRGAIQITPESVGALPIINTLTVDKAEAMENENINANYTVKRLGEGKVSRGLRIEDPNLFRVPADNMFTNHSYSVALWLKPDELIAGSDGIGLLNRCSRFNNTGPWMTSTRGDFWVSIRELEEIDNPRWKMGEISYSCTTMTGDETWGNPWENPAYPMLSEGYAVQAGTWSHLVISHDKETNMMRIFFNGKLVKEANVPFGVRDGGPIYVGLANNRRTSYCGVIDELQVWNKALATETEVSEAMKGYETAPDGLVAYYTFEEKNADETFNNKGTLGADEKYNGSVVIIDETEKAEPIQPASNGELGCPIIPGTLPIVTTAKWEMPGASFTTGEKSATGAYNIAGDYTIGLSLVNDWGSDRQEQQITIVVDGTGIEDFNSAADFNIYPNPFVEKANISFKESGAYTISVFNGNGQLMKSETYEVTAGDVRELTFDANPGVYYVTIVTNGKCVKSFKLGKK